MLDSLPILIVDDDLNMTVTLKDILEEKGFNVDIANDGFKAIEMIRRIKYDLAFMDIKMPEINGVETFKRIKQLSPSTKVVMMTAYSLEELIKEALDEGAYAILYKPFDLNKVLNLVEKASEGMLILIVDDDLNACMSIQDILRGNGYKTRIATNGQQAIDFVNENGFEIVIIDAIMPVLNGLETHLKIKEINPQITTIMITGYEKETKKMMQAALEASIYTCLYKPIDPKEILSIIERITENKFLGKEI
ncbi:MAG: response regulator [Candidatus Heimdallarchaeaceae archaeon]